MTDDKFAALVRAQIAILDMPKKVLARRCHVTRPDFSRMIRGEQPIPSEVRDRLIKELGIEKQYAKLIASMGG